MIAEPHPHTTNGATRSNGGAVLFGSQSQRSAISDGAYRWS